MINTDTRTPTDRSGKRSTCLSRADRSLSRSINPIVVGELFGFFRQSPELLGRDVVGLVVLTLGRAVQKSLFAEIQVPSGLDFLATARLACEAVVDHVHPWGGVQPHGRTPALFVFDVRSNAIQRAMIAFEDWSEGCTHAWRRFADEEPVGDRWETVLRLRGMVMETVYPRELEQFPFAAEDALSRLSELSDPDDERTTADEIHTALFQVHHSLVLEKGAPGLFVGHDGRLRLGWTQSRDALAHEREISRRKLRAEREECERSAEIVRRARAEHHVSTAQIVEDVEDVADAVDVVNEASKRDVLDCVRDYADRRLAEVDPGTNRWHVVRHLVALLNGEMTVSGLASLVGRDHAGLWRAYDEERTRVTTLLQED